MHLLALASACVCVGAVYYKQIRKSERKPPHCIFRLLTASDPAR